MAESIPAQFPGNEITMTASATITAGQLVEVTGNYTVGPAGAASVKVVGVAASDAASSAQVNVYTRGVHYLTASGAIAAGDLLVAGAAGVVATAGAASAAIDQQIVGIALEAIADTALGRVKIKNV